MFRFLEGAKQNSKTMKVNTDRCDYRNIFLQKHDNEPMF